MREMKARYASKCKGCGRAVRVGDAILWAKGTGVFHNGGCSDVYWGNEFGRQEAAQERAAYAAEMDAEGALIAREEAEYQRGYHGTKAIQAISKAGSAFREQLYAEQEAQWAREGFDG